MEFMKQKWSSGLVLGLVFASLLVVGCSKGSKDVSTAVSTPSAANFQPKGLIQGILVDSVTNAPIVNAVVSIGLAVGVTNAQGQYVIGSVPATYDALNGTVTGSYTITVDLRKVTSPVNMASSATTPRYPDFSYSSVSVNFTSLNDANTCQDNTNSDGGTPTCGTNNTNHDTPVDGLVANEDMSVGKLDANISGTVFGGCGDSSLPDYYAVKAGYVVNLLSNGSVNSSTGNDGHIVGATTTDASGVFTFTNIEAQQDFLIQVMDSATKTVFQQTADVTSGSDGATNTDYLEASNAIHVCPVNSDGPTITLLSIEPGADLAPIASQDVTITFNEPVDTSSPSASTDPSNQQGLIATGNLDVEYDGNKAPVPFKAVWNGAGDQLTVTFATGSSSLYEVYLNVGSLQDTVGRSAETGLCPNDAPGPWAGIGGGGSDCDVYFSTNGPAIPGATTSLTVLNAAGLDDDSGSAVAVLDWPTISGANTYNVYCGQDQINPDDTIQTGATSFYDTSGGFSGLNVDVTTIAGFSGNGTRPYAADNGWLYGLEFRCFVRGVNSDLVEGPDSNTVTISDVIGPLLSIGGSGTDLDGFHPGKGQVLVDFNEPVRESTATTLTNYVLTGTDAALTLISATLDSNSNVVTLTYSNVFTAAPGGDTLTVTGVKDVTGNTNRTAGAVNVVTFP